MMELQLLVLQERKNIFLARQITARQRGHGFHTRPLPLPKTETTVEIHAKKFTEVIFYWRPDQHLMSSSEV